MAERPAKVTIGFQGGQVLGARLTASALKDLREAVPHGGWRDVEVDDGAVALDLSQVVYLHTESDEHRVGFGL